MECIFVVYLRINSVKIKSDESKFALQILVIYLIQSGKHDSKQLKRIVEYGRICKIQHTICWIELR